MPTTKTCPRCGCVGAVTPDPDAPGFFIVDWQRDDENARDTMVSADDLANPDFGCGYDLESAP